MRSSIAYSIEYIPLQSIVATLERSREESWEAVSNRVSTLVEGSVNSLSGRLTEIEHVLQSQRTTPVETEDAVVNAETVKHGQHWNK